MDATPLWLLFSLLALLLLCSAFFSSSETGMMAINRYRLKHLQKKHRGARRVSELLERPDRLIGVILIGNNLANNFAAIVAAAIAIKLYGNGSEFLAGIALTIVMLIFAEVTPKTIAALHPERVAFPFSLLLKPLLTLLYPVVWLVNQVSNRLVRLFGVDPNKGSNDALSKDELRTVVDESGSNIPTDNQGMLLNILELEDVTVDDIMVPRNEIYGIDLEDDLDTITDRIVTSEYTRLPVFEDNINEVIGLLHIRSASRLLRGNAGEMSKEAIKRFAAESYFVPENTPLHTQLMNFRRTKHRTALVVDEYGEVQGLVTLEDILEEIVGDFTTNLAEEAVQDIESQKDGSFVIDATATIRDINKATDWELPTDGPKTLNGLAIEQLEDIPDGNVSFTLGDYRFETVLLDEMKVIKLRASRILSAESPESL
ncbi:HlyC/CorC family transporter [Porticoccus sp. W117]|uniref:HlyC/CorC family transporter n=1 Tax=Porticoccus sp. W117 TaxID=3054777 RepID=UPI0025987C13|nr:HlyC/CorC family transporter [Porticoccus sp. W117]MDM3872645.1 HlyC/CorC family transporter [Porticoccus sp. W117]